MAVPVFGHDNHLDVTYIPTFVEGNSGFQQRYIKVELTRQRSGYVSFQWQLYSVAGPTAATAGVDFKAQGGFEDDYYGDETFYLPVTVYSDLIDEPNETFLLRIYNRVNIQDGDTSATLTITDDDLPIQVSAADISFDEGNGSGTGQAQFQVRIVNPNQLGFYLRYAVQPDDPASAAPGADFQPYTSDDVYVSGTTTTKPITVTIVRDNTPEPDETFVLSLQPGVGGAPVQVVDPIARATIRNDDVVPLNIAVADPATVIEGHSGTRAVAFTVSLSAPAPAGGAAVTWETRDGSAVAGQDYQAASGTLTIPAGASAGQVVVNALGDAVAEPTLEQFELKLLSTPTPNATIADGIAAGTIKDDDKVSVSVFDQAVQEGDADLVVQVEIRVSGQASYPILVEFSTGGGSATAGADYTPVSNLPLTIAPGQQTAFAPVTVRGDQEQEPSEDVGVSIACATSDGLSVAQPNASISISDDDVPAPLPAIGISDHSNAEGNSGLTAFDFTLKLSAPAPGPVSVYAMTVDGTADPSDYEVMQGQVNIPAGAESATITVMVKGDNSDESDETFSVVLSNPQGATLGDPSARGTIANDDASGGGGTPYPLLRVDDVVAVEGDQGNTRATIVFSLSAPVVSTAAVDYRLEPGSATADVDYQSVAGQIVFSVGQTRAELDLTIVGDLLDEGNETVVVELLSASGLDLARTSALVTILDDDGAGPALPMLSIAGTELAEGPAGVQHVTLQVTLDRSPASTVRVSYRTRDGSASSADEDFVARSGEVVFNAGQTSAEVTIAVNGDERAEEDESFEVELYDPVNAGLAIDRATVTLRNDDEEQIPSVFLVAPGAVTEGSGVLATRVRLSAPAVRQVEVLAWVEPGTAQEHADYKPTATRLKWAPGESADKTLRVQLVDDRVIESSETVRLMLRLISLDDALLGTHAVAATITDDDAGALRLVADQTELRGKRGAAIELLARVVDGGDRPVAAAVVSWSGESPLQLDSGRQTASAADGIVLQRVLAGTTGRYAVDARLEGSDQQVRFSVVVEGALADLFDPQRNPNEESVARALDRACPGSTGDLDRLCDDLLALPESAQRDAVVAITPGLVTVQGDAAVQAAKVQIQNVNARQAQLRAGARGALSGLSVDLRGNTVPLQQAAQTLRGMRNRTPLNARVDQQLAALRGESDVREPVPTQPAANRVVREQGESRVGFFVNGRLSVGEHERSSLEPGYELTTQGLTSGVDYRFSDNLFAGVAFGYLDSETRLRGDAGGLEASGYSLTLYSAWQQGALWVDAAASFGRNDLDLRRGIRLPAPLLGQTRFDARGATDASQRGLNVGVGYDGHLRALEIGGFARGLVSTVDIDGYTETGASALAATFGDQTVRSSELEAGVELAYPLSVAWGAIHPLMRLSYLHELDNDARAIGGSFAFDVTDQEFAILTENPDRNYFNLALGLQFTLRRSRLFYFTLDSDLAREDLDQYTLSIGYRQQF